MTRDSVRDADGTMATICLPLFSGRLATCSAAQMIAPLEMPTGMPSSLLISFETGPESSSLTLMISSTILTLRLSGTKPAPMPCSLCGPGCPPESTGDLAGSTAIALKAGLRDLMHFGHAGDRAARADARDDDVHPAVRVAPDLLGRCLAMNLRVGGVGELLRDDAVRESAVQFLRLGDGALHPFGARSAPVRAPRILSSLRRSMLIVSGMVRMSL